MIVKIKVSRQFRCTKIARKNVAERIGVKNFSSSTFAMFDKGNEKQS